MAQTAQHTRGWTETTKQALLLAAAPDMLAALKKIVAHWDDLHPKDRQQARAAIAKATGAA